MTKTNFSFPFIGLFRMLMINLIQNKNIYHLADHRIESDQSDHDMSFFFFSLTGLNDRKVM